jgi:hypothetical protein
MYPTADLRYCKNCGCEISICAFVIEGEIYCCEDCYQHLPCHCCELVEQEDRHQNKQPSPIYPG